ncbi:hypothetical protein QFZ36_000500 [Pseudarthrobacter siccitolerans]|uniref:DUF3168 domain-containing protein n=1 Tax=Pseudarthrobacter siccitolerans TaxID=861266 RepID=A0ABU0PG46_9MICC|nr:hypothetical protein [Pseudarthrobacter siccitolerans]MDQ0672939.1 hypothetical protein [Pseudarthrobacter siccitolerans]
MSNLSTISNEIKTIVEGVQQSGSAAFTEVVEYPTNEFEGYPAASVVPTAVESTVFTSTQNQRAYGFMVELYYNVDQNNWASAFDIMRDLVDAVLDALDQSEDLNASCDFLKAVPMEWTLQEAGQGLVLATEIRLAAVKDVDVR